MERWEGQHKMRENEHIKRGRCMSGEIKYDEVRSRGWKR